MEQPDVDKPEKTMAPRTSTQPGGGWDTVTTTPYYPGLLSTSDYGRVIPVFTVMPETEAYVIRDQPATLSCGAMEATLLVFVCNGERVPQEKEVDAFKVHNTDRYMDTWVDRFMGRQMDK